jgi:hypothetical protein
VGVDQANDVGIDLPGKGRLNDAYGLGVGDPQTLDELRFDPALVHRLADVRTATMNDDWIDADVVKHRDVIGERASETFIHHRRAAVLDHDGCVPELLDERQRLGEDLGLAHRSGDRGFTTVRCGVACGHDRSALKRT